MSIGGSDQGEKVKVNLSLNLTMEMVEILDQLKAEYGAASRGRVVEMLLQDFIAPEA